MAKKTGRKANLRLIAAKRGWEDGHNDREPDPPKKSVMNPFANGSGFNPVPTDEEDAYWDAFNEGEAAPKNAINPYRQERQP